MKKFFALLTLFLCFSVHSQDATAVNNAIKMGYNFVTVSQTVVFNSAMQSGGTLTFSADATDGGGRNPGDPFTLKLVFYNSANQIITTVQQANTLVLGGALQTYTLSTTDCGGSCANVSYVSVQFYGKDGGYWAGNYGPYIINPSLKYNGGSNILYNPEFGVYGTNGYAQGWTSSNGWQSCALYSGAQTCVVNNGAQVNGGNYSSSGGTTSGTSGGYVAAPTGPTVEGGTITQTNAPSNQTILSGSGSSGPTTQQTTRINTWKNTPQGVNNYLYVEQISGDYNNVTITQSGTFNTTYLGMAGAGSNTVNISQQGSAYLNGLVQGSSNSFTSTQSNTAGNNYQETKIIGNSNNVTTSQTGNASQLMFNTITGSNNTVNATQSGTAHHYLSTTLNGNGNSVLSDQSGNTSNNATISITNSGGPGSVDLQQTGGKSFNLIQSCTNPAGCSTVIRQ